MVHRQSLLGTVDPSFRALPGRLKLMVRRHKFNEDSSLCKGAQKRAPVVALPSFQPTNFPLQVFG